jgi:D-alanyl-D-alanine endopeptidase (penicillin-binding protein 7)
VHRILALFVALALSTGALAADKPAKATRAAAVTNAEPTLKSAGVLVLDPTTGQTLYSKNADEVTPIASITKLMTAMVVLDAKLPLEEPVQITTEDIDLLKNTKSRLPIGSHFRRDDLMRLALMASDNRAASALGRNFPGGLDAFVEAMNKKSQELGLTHTRFVDSSGLAPGNVSSAGDLGKLVVAASSYDLIREYSTTEAVNVTLPDSKRKLSFVNTNRLVRGSEWQIGLSKTGYISESGLCLVMQAMIANQPVVIVLLDSWGKLTRVGDANRIKKWLEKNPTKFSKG